MQQKKRRRLLEDKCRPRLVGSFSRGTAVHTLGESKAANSWPCVLWPLRRFQQLNLIAFKLVPSEEGPSSHDFLVLSFRFCFFLI